MKTDHVGGPLYILLVEKEGQPTSLVIHLESSFHSLFEVYIGEEGNKSIMDQKRKKRKNNART